MRKFPDANLEQVKDFIRLDDPGVFDNVPRQTVNSLLQYNIREALKKKPFFGDKCQTSSDLPPSSDKKPHTIFHLKNTF